MKLLKRAADAALYFFRKNSEKYRENLGDDARHGQLLWAQRTEYNITQITEYIEYLENENETLRGKLPDLPDKLPDGQHFLLFALRQLYELQRNDTDKLLRHKAYRIEKIREEVNILHTAGGEENPDAQKKWLLAEKLEAELNILAGLSEFHEKMYNAYIAEYRETVSEYQRKLTEQQQINEALTDYLRLSAKLQRFQTDRL